MHGEGEGGQAWSRQTSPHTFHWACVCAMTVADMFKQRHGVPRHPISGREMHQRGCALGEPSACEALRDIVGAVSRECGAGGESAALMCGLERRMRAAMSASGGAK